MLTEEEKSFMAYWEQNRGRQKKILRQFLLGIPAGLALAIAIVINLSSGWYKRADMIVHTQDFNPGVLIVALLLIVGFTAIFSRRHRWDMNEQHYQELKAKELQDPPGKEKKEPLQHFTAE